MFICITLNRRQILPPDTGAGGGDTFAAISSSAAFHSGNATAATPTPSTLRPEMMAVEALSGMVSALTVAAAATTAKKAGKAAASEKHGGSDAAEAELAETVLRGKSISLSSQLPSLLHAYLLQFLLHQ